MAKNWAGERGELLAARYLRDHGLRIEAANYHSRFGEIDLIASDSQYIIFIEVKARGNRMLFSPREAVDIRKRERIVKTAMCYLAAAPTSLQPRFDVIEVFLGAGSDHEKNRINHIENAFDAEGYYAAL